jgi:hypothetical protein
VEVTDNTTESIGSPTLSVSKRYHPERESTFVPREPLNMIHAVSARRRIKNSPVVISSSAVSICIIIPFFFFGGINSRRRVLF